MKNLILDEISGALRKSVPLAASVYINPLSGGFLTQDASGNFALSLAADTQIYGYTSQRSGTASFSSTAATDFVTIDVDTEKVYELPASTTITAAAMKLLLFRTCDIAISGSALTLVQQANVTASSTDVLVICGWDISAQTVYVRMNPAKMYAQGIA